MRYQRYSSEFQSVWDAFINETAWNGTFLHTRKFLSYHEGKFKDFSLLIYDEDERIIGLFPAAVHPRMQNTVVSHPGATFGGLVIGGLCRGQRCISVLNDITEYYRGEGFKQLLYKVTPLLYHQTPLQDDLYALFRLGFRRVRCDISATVSSNNRPALTKGRKYEIGKAKKRGVEIVEGVDYLNGIHRLIEDNLWEAHQVKPVHEVSELLLLHSRFPKNLRFIAARHDAEVIAGLVMFNFQNVAHTQYIASNQLGRETGALDMLIEQSIKSAFADDYEYFDFGVSNEEDGKVLNEGLYRYKRTFGAGSVVHEFYELDL